MPGLTLVTGGPASGKTERLLAVVAARYQADALADVLVLVPTARHADQFRQRLVTRVGVAVGLDVTTLRLFAARLTSDAPVAPPEVARELLARATVERAETGGPARRFVPIARTGGLQSLMRAAASTLASAAVDPIRFAEGAARSGDPDLEALAEVYAAYLDALRGRGWQPPEARAALAAQAVAVHPLPPLVVIDGVQFLEPGEVRLVAALAAGAEVWAALDTAAGARGRWTFDALRRAVPDTAVEALPAPPPLATFEAYSTADHEAQLREIARSIKQRLAEDATLRPSDVAVAVRRVGPYLAAARRVFREFELPLDPAAGERLAERPFGIWTLRLLRLGVRGWRLLDALDAFGAGFFAAERAGFRPGGLERLRRLGRDRDLWSGLDTLRRLPDAAGASTPDGTPPDPRTVAAAEVWLAAMDRLAPLLDPEVRRTPGAHAALIADALFGAQALVRETLEGEPSFAVEVAALRRDLDGFRAIDEALGAEPVAFSVFVDHLERGMQRPTTLIREAGGVLLAPMHTLHGLRFRHAYLAGLAEGEFPAPVRTGGLLSTAARATLAAAGIDLPPEARATEDELWQAAVSRAVTTTLWHPRFDASGRRAAPSYYLEASRSEVTPLPVAPEPEVTASTRELALSLTRRWPSEVRRPPALPAWGLVVRAAASVEQRRRSFASAGRFEGAVAGIDTRALVDPSTTWSASRLEAYRTCPFQFFVRYALRLHELEEEQPEADAATRGSVMHAILEDALRPLAEAKRALDGEALEEVIARLRTAGRAIWDEAPRNYAFGREALWRHEGDAAIERLERLLRREAEHHRQLGMTAVEGGERRFEEALPGVEPPFRLQATLDRLDTGEGGIHVVDYKTGRAILRRHLEDGERLQLQLYALIASSALGAERFVARYSFLREPKNVWRLDSASAEDRALLDDAVALAVEVRDRVAAGRFEVAPRPSECPPYCAARTVCRVTPFSRFKTWS